MRKCEYVTSASLAKVYLKCECGRRYLIDFKRRQIRVETQSGVLEYVPYENLEAVFIVKCPYCDAEVEVQESKDNLMCWRCRARGVFNSEKANVQWYSRE